MVRTKRDQSKDLQQNVVSSQRENRTNDADLLRGNNATGRHDESDIFCCHRSETSLPGRHDKRLCADFLVELDDGGDHG